MGAGQPIGTVRRPLFHSLRAGTLQRAWRQGRVSCAVLVGDSGSGRVAQRAREAIRYTTAQGLPSLAEQLGPMPRAQRPIAADLTHLTQPGEMRRQDVLAVNAGAIP